MPEVVDFDYDDPDRSEFATYRPDGQLDSYSFEAFLPDAALEYQYDEQGRMNRVVPVGSVDRGITFEVEYDGEGRPMAEYSVDDDGNRELRLRHIRNDAGQITAFEFQFGGPSRTAVFSYDDRGRRMQAQSFIGRTPAGPDTEPVFVWNHVWEGDRLARVECTTDESAPSMPADCARFDTIVYDYDCE